MKTGGQEPQSWGGDHHEVKNSSMSVRRKKPHGRVAPELRPIEDPLFCRKREFKRRLVVTKRLLLHCDDDPDAAFFLERALHRSGVQDWELESVTSGEQALTYLKRAQRGEIPMPDLLVLDVKMPGMNGFEVLDRLRFNGVNIITVMLSMSDDVKDRLRAIDMGSRGYFVKSSNYEDLIRVLRNWEAEFPQAHSFLHN